MTRRAVPLVLLALCGCASSAVAVRDRAVVDELELLEWRPATASDVAGPWGLASLEGPAGAVLMDLAYWIAADGRFSGAALFAGPPPAYEVLSGAWSLAEDGVLQLGADAEPARAEVSGSEGSEVRLRLGGSAGRLVLERAEIR